VQEMLGEAGLAARHRDESQRLYAQHREQQARIVALLDKALLGLDAKLM